MLKFSKCRSMFRSALQMSKLPTNIWIHDHYQTGKACVSRHHGRIPGRARRGGSCTGRGASPGLYVATWPWDRGLAGDQCHEVGIWNLSRRTKSR